MAIIFRRSGDAVRKNVQQLDAHIAETAAMRTLIEARIQVAVTLVDFSPTVLREICATHFLAGRRKRASDLLLQDLACELTEVNAHAALIDARKKLQALEPPKTAAAPDAAHGLTPDEVDEVAGTLPEIPEETRRTFLQLLKARLKEKFS
jgi:hypothetical protein